MTVDIAGFITDMKAHAVDHGFHVHAERHFIESFSLGQAWEVDLHPEGVFLEEIRVGRTHCRDTLVACGGIPPRPTDKGTI